MDLPDWDSKFDLPKELISGLNEYVNTEFAGLEVNGLSMTRFVLGNDGSMAAHWRLQARHGELAQPSEKSGGEFLGWQPTGAEIDLHIASFTAGEEDDGKGRTLVHEWDRMHGLFQIGVHAVGRPLVGQRPSDPGD
ncbi:MAG: hypothetical protein ABIP13_07155 [Tepidiformaceae bacterium]